MGLILRMASWTPGPESSDGVGVSHSLSGTSPGEQEQCNGLFKPTLNAGAGRTLKHWDLHFVKVTWSLNTQGSTGQAGPAQCEPPAAVEGNKVSVVHARNVSGKSLDQSCPKQRQTHPWGCFCSRTWVHLVGDAEGRGAQVSLKGL